MDDEYNVYLSDIAKLDIKHISTVQGYIDFTVKVSSQDFYGEHAFSLDKDGIGKVLSSLTCMIRNLKGECIIKDDYPKSFIMLRFIDNIKNCW